MNDDDDDDDDVDSIISVSSNTAKENDVKTRGELSINDLPPIEDLKISVDEEKCEPVGCIKSVVDTLGKYKCLNYSFYSSFYTASDSISKSE